MSKQFAREFTLRTGYEITERTMDRNGQLSLIPDVEVETWWSNLGDPDKEIIQLYHYKTRWQYQAYIPKSLALYYKI